MTLALLALLLLAVFALSALVRVSSQTAGTSSDQAAARQNALLALSVALGELQRATGADSRRTGNAGIAGIGAQDSRRQWTGVWGGTPSPIWLASNAAAGVTPTIPGSRVQLVGPGSVGSPSDRTDQELVEVGLVEIPSISFDGQLVNRNRIAYWVGDEGAKVSAAIQAIELQTNNAGVALRPDTRRLLGSNFEPSASTIGRLLTFEQIKIAFSNISLTGAFHQTTLSAKFVPTSAPNAVANSGVYAAGAFNINTSSVPAWRAWFEFPSSQTTATTNLSLNATQSLRLAQRVAGAIAARGAPFAETADFVNSGIIHVALNTTPRITGITEAQILDALSPIWAVRSDTFRIRAYGDVLSADESGAILASAYCEAIVQRTPEVIDSIAGPFGRRYVIVSFRWLSPDDI